MTQGQIQVKSSTQSLIFIIIICLGNCERSFAITRLGNFEWLFAITQIAYILMFVLVSLALFYSTNVNSSLLQTGITLYLQLYFTSRLSYFLFSCAAQSKSCDRKVDKAIYLFFGNFHYKI